MNKLLLFSICMIFLYGCSNKTKELEAKISQLEIELDNCKNGADKLLGKIKSDFENKSYKSVVDLYSSLQREHPTSPEFAEAKVIYEQVSDILEKEEADAKKKEAEKLAKIEKEKSEKLASLKKLKKKVDDISGNTWYYNPYFTHYNNSNRMSIYIGDNGGSTWLRLVMSYYGDDWIFFKSAYLSYDGNTLEIPFDDYKNKKTENEGGNVWEWIDIAPDNSIIPFLESFANSPNAKMRLSGKYTETRTLTSNERKGISDVINGYKVLQETQ